MVSLLGHAAYLSFVVSMTRLDSTQFLLLQKTYASLMSSATIPEMTSQNLARKWLAYVVPFHELAYSMEWYVSVAYSIEWSRKRSHPVNPVFIFQLWPTRLPTRHRVNPPRCSGWGSCSQPVGSYSWQRRRWRSRRVFGDALRWGSRCWCTTFTVPRFRVNVDMSLKFSMLSLLLAL